MNTSASLPTVTLNPKKEVPLLGGHPWVFSGGVAREPKDLAPGSLVKVISNYGDELGIGTYNPLTNIRVRMITRDTSTTIDTDFFAKRFAELDAWKQNHLPSDTNGYRLVCAEADDLPGLIIDRYDNTFVFQLHTAGMEHFRQEIIDALTKTFHPAAIVERSDIEVRKQEGLTTMPVTTHLGTVPEFVPFKENGYVFHADVMRGQKTGFFLDQRDARTEVGKLSKNKRVLNLFSYTGAFSIYAAKNGASFVTSVDVSDQAINQAKDQFRANGLDPEDTSRSAFIAADIFDYTTQKPPAHGPYDLIVCDPPALAKTEAHIFNASKAYVSLNQLCFSLLQKGGILVTSSCSGRITQEAFRDILRIAAGRAQKKVKILKWITQAADHAESLAFTEGRYLKTAILEVV